MAHIVGGGATRGRIDARRRASDPKFFAFAVRSCCASATGQLQ